MFATLALISTAFGGDLAQGVRSLTSFTAYARAWSPDGTRLLIAKSDGLWVAPLSEPERLVVRTPSQPATEVAWTPDGSKIVFVAYRPGDSQQTIWLANADGSNLRDMLPLGTPLVYTGSLAVGLTGWDDRGRLVFWNHCGSECSYFNALDLASGALTPLRMGAGEARWANGTGHGALDIYWQNTVGLVERTVDQGGGRSWIFDRAWDDPRRVSRLFDSWAPDGRSFLYTAWEPRDPEEIGEGRGTPVLASYDLESKARRVIAQNTAWGAWSPDGARIAATRLEPTNDKSINARLVILDASSGRTLASAPLGSARREAWILTGSERRPVPAWSPDGAAVVVQGADRSLVRIDTATGRLAPVTAFPAHAQWAPAGEQRLLVTRDAVQRTYVEGTGIDLYLPPVGANDTATPAARIDRYYRAVLDRPKSPDVDPYWYRAYSQAHANALWILGRMREAEASFRRAYESSDQGVDREYRRDALADFLWCTDRQYEALKLSPPPAPNEHPVVTRNSIGGTLLTPEQEARLPKQDRCARQATPTPPPGPPTDYVVAFD